MTEYFASFYNERHGDTKDQYTIRLIFLPGDVMRHIGHKLPVRIASYFAVASLPVSFIILYYDKTVLHSNMKHLDVLTMILICFLSIGPWFLLWLIHEYFTVMVKEQIMKSGILLRGNVINYHTGEVGYRRGWVRYPKDWSEITFTYKFELNDSHHLVTRTCRKLVKKASLPMHTSMLDQNPEVSILYLDWQRYGIL